MGNRHFDELWRLAESEASRRGESPEYVFLSIGLALNPTLETWDYRSTPQNSSTFASTGGDGVHYGLLHVRGALVDESPVVMTVPMNFDHENLIVGEDLLDFLALGCRFGYFALEQLTYQRERATAWIECATEKDLASDERELVACIRSHFRLEVWKNVAARLQQLQDRFIGSIVLPEREDEAR